MSAGTPRPHACVAEWSPPACGGAAVVAGGALDAVELEDESSDGGGGVATALPGSRRLALSESFWQRVAAEGGAGRGRRRAKTKFGIVVGRLVICITVVVFQQKRCQSNTRRTVAERFSPVRNAL